MKKLAILVAMVVFGLSASPAFGQATRTWVSGVGDDVNPCSRTAPCKTFAGAISKTFTGGEIDVLDDGGFGTLTITKSITIDGGGHLASALSSGVNGLNINIADGNPNDPNRRVVLRNLSINGAGALGAIGTNTGVIGVNINTNGADTVHLENLRIFGFTQHGIKAAPTAGGALNLSLDNVTVADIGGGNPANAVELKPPDATRPINALIRNCVFKGSRATTPSATSGVGILADSASHVWLTGSTVFDNQVGLQTRSTLGSPGVFDSFCNNQIAGNTDNGVTPNELCPQPAAAPPPAPTVVTEIQTVPGPKQCIVPALKGLPVSFAKRLLKATNCALGKVTKKKTTKRSRIGRVMSQKTKAGSALADGTKINVTVGRR